MPFEELEPPPFTMSAEWTLEQYAAYLRTWSAVQRNIADRLSDPVDELAYTLRPFWGEPHGRRTVRWTLSVRAARK